MKKKSALLTILFFLGLGTAALAYLCTSAAGLRFSLGIAGHMLPGTLSIASIQGSLADTIRLRGAAYQDANIEVTVRDFTLSWRPAALLHKTLDISSLATSGMIIRLQSQNTPALPAPEGEISLPPLILPLAIRLGRASVNSADLYFPQDPMPVHLASITLENILGKGTELQIGSLDVTAPAYRLRIGGTMQIGEAAAAHLTVDGDLNLPDYFPMGGRAEIAASPAELGITLQVQRPFQGLLKANVTDLTGKIHWKAELESDQAQLATIGRDWPEFVLTRFSAAGSGTLTDYAIQLETDAQYGRFQGFHLHTAITGDVNGLALANTTIALAEESLQGYGSLDWQDTFSWQAELAGKQLTLASLDPSWPAAVLSDITLSGKGEMDTYSLAMQGEATYGNLRNMHARTVVEGNADGLRLTNTLLRLPEGEITAEGQLSWTEALTWEAALNGKSVNPALWQPEWPGRLDFTVQTSGFLEDNTLKSGIDIVSLGGTLRDYPLQASGNLELDGGNLEIRSLSLQSGESTMLAAGRYAEAVDIGFEMQSPDLAALWPGASGKLRAKGRLAGSRLQPDLLFNLSGESLALDELRIGTVSADAQGGLAPGASLHARITAGDIAAGDSPKVNIESELQGTTAAHQLSAEINSGAGSVHLQLAGGLSQSSWLGTLNRIDIVQEDLGSWHLLEATEVAISTQGASVTQFCLEGVGSARACLAGSVLPEALWQTSVRIESLPLKLLQPTPYPAAAIEGILSGILNLAGDRRGINTGNLQLTADNASLLLMIPNEQSRRIAWQGNSFQATLADKDVTATLHSVIVDGSTVSASLHLQDALVEPYSLRHKQLEGSLAFAIKELQPLAALTYPAIDPYGALEGKISLQGTLAEPRLIGTAHLLQGKMVIPPLGISLEGVKIDIDGRGTAFNILASGRSDNGLLQASGNLSLVEAADPRLTFTLKGERFAAVQLPELQVWLSPDLQGTIARQHKKINGTVRIPKAIIAPRDIAGAVTPSEDVVIVAADNEARKSDWPLTGHLSILAGDEVRIDAFGLKGGVQGRLEVSALPGKPVTGEGVLKVTDGTFSIYGRELTIKTGRLLYNGNPLDNPGVDVRAENTTNEVTTGIQVTGFLSEPEISFYSTPPMEESAIISRLLMNTSLLGKTKQDEGFLGSVGSGAVLDPLTSTVRGVKEGLRLDDVKLEAGKKREDLSLVIGTWLTPELYISYGKNLLKESGSFNTRYLLGHGFSVQTESGATQSGADLKYEIDR